MERGSEPGLAAGEGPGNPAAAVASAASVAAAASDATGSAIAAVVRE